MSGSVPRVNVEFYGLARLRAGRVGCSVEAFTVGDALAAADATCSGLRAIRSGGVSSEYLVSVGGARFTTDPNEPLAGGASLLILGADSGG